MAIGTTLEVTVVKDRYNNATKIDTVTTDTNWIISLTPLGYDHNQLGILRESSSNQGNSDGQPPQSSYARVSLMKFAAVNGSFLRRQLMTANYRVTKFVRKSQ